MATDDERRRVAERLRDLTSNVYGLRKSYESEGFSILCDDQADYYQICHAVSGYLPPEHMHPCDYEELHARLADIIEPPLQCPYYDSSRHYCSVHDLDIDHDARHRLSDLIEPAPTSSDTTVTHTDTTATRDTSQSCRDTVACDREALLALADTIEEARDALPYKTVDWTDVVTINRSMLGDIARRVREACGEVEP